MRRLPPLLALFACVLASARVQAQAGGLLLVISKTNHTVALVDPVTLKVKGKAPTGEDPHEVIASSDGRTAYVSNYGGGAYHTIQVIDLASMTPRPQIDLGPLNGPHGLAFVDGRLWFTAEGAKVVGRYDPGSGKIDTVIGTGQNRTHMVWLTPDEKLVITTNVSSGTVSLIEQVAVQQRPPGPPPGGNPAGQPGPPPGPPPGMDQPRRDHDWNQTVVPAGPGCEGFDVSPDRREVWTANAGDGTISVIDIAGKNKVATIQADIRGANRLKFTPDGKYVLISLLSGPDLVVLDAHTHAVIKRLPIGHGAAGIEIEPGGRRAFVACGPDNYVAIIDLATLTLAGHFEVGGNPDGMAWVAAK